MQNELSKISKKWGTEKFTRIKVLLVPRFLPRREKIVAFPTATSALDKISCTRHQPIFKTRGRVRLAEGTRVVLIQMSGPRAGSP